MATANSGKGRYAPVEPLSMEEIEALPASIGSRSLGGVLNISIPSAQRLMKSGKLKSARQYGKLWRVSKAEVLEYAGLH